MLTKLNFELKRSREEEAALEHCVYIMSAIGSKERKEEADFSTIASYIL